MTTDPSQETSPSNETQIKEEPPVQKKPVREKSKPKKLFDPLKGSYTDFSIKTIELPDGLLIDDELYRTVTIKPLSAVARKNMSKANVIKSQVKVINLLLKYCIVEIDGLSNITERHLSMLTSTDRDTLQVYIHDLTYGNILTDVTCENCENELTLEKSIDELKLVNLPEETQNNIEHGERLANFSHDEYGSVRLKLLTGKDLDSLQKQTANSISRETTYRALARSIYDFNGTPITYEHLIVWPIEVIDWVEACAIEHQHGFDPMIEEDCPECGKKLLYVLDYQSFLFRKPSKNSKKK